MACGTSYHAAIVGRFMLERLTGITAEVDLGSEYRYRDAVLGPETLVIALSQSGETADTLGAVKAARAKGAPIVGITNVVGSALSREATGTLYTHAGPEIGVASSKTFTSTLDRALPARPSGSGAGAGMLGRGGRAQAHPGAAGAAAADGADARARARGGRAGPRALPAQELPLPGPRDQLSRSRSKARSS